MGPLLGKVIDTGRGVAQGAGSMMNRVWQAPGYFGNKGVNKLEEATFNHLSRNAGDRAEAAAQRVYMNADMPKPTDVDMGKEVFNNLRDSTYQNLQNRARFQAALVPGGLRFAGRAATSPLAMTAYGVGGTLAAGQMMEEHAQRKQLAEMGLTPEDAEILTNELAMAAQNMEPTEYI